MAYCHRGKIEGMVALLQLLLAQPMHRNKAKMQEIGSQTMLVTKATGWLTKVPVKGSTETQHYSLHTGHGKMPAYLLLASFCTNIRVPQCSGFI